MSVNAATTTVSVNARRPTASINTPRPGLRSNGKPSRRAQLAFARHRNRGPVSTGPGRHPARRA
jgi:hypothetical protein